MGYLKIVTHIRLNSLLSFYWVVSKVFNEDFKKIDGEKFSYHIKQLRKETNSCDGVFIFVQYGNGLCDFHVSVIFVWGN